MKFYETPEGVDQYFEMSEGYDLSRYSEVILKHLPQGKSLLEVGMGPGNDFVWLSKLYKVTGSDYSSEFIRRAKTRFPGAELQLLDGTRLETNRKFDSIFSSKVYQHISLEKLAEVFERQWAILNQGGVILHSFWIGGTVEEIEDMRFYYHDERALLSAIEERFSILFTEKYAEFEEGDSLFLIGVKKNGDDV